MSSESTIVSISWSARSRPGIGHTFTHYELNTGSSGEGDLFTRFVVNDIGITTDHKHCRYDVRFVTEMGGNTSDLWCTNRPQGHSH